MNTNRALFNSITILGVAAALAAGIAEAQNRGTGFVPLNRFLDQTRNTRAHDAAREEMRQHILQRYEGVEVRHSFADGSAYFDCVPVMQQPSVRKLGLDGTAAEPPKELLARDGASNDPAAEGPTSPALRVGADAAVDEFGNATGCEA